MRSVVAAGLLLLALATTACQQAAAPAGGAMPAASAAAAKVSDGAPAANGKMSDAAAASPAAVTAVPDVGYVAIGDTTSDIFFLSGVKTARFAGPSATDPALSPDGRSVAYVVIDPGRRSQIMRSNLDGSGVRVLLEAVDMIFTPCWSPDGRRLAFLRKGEGEFALCTMAADGGEPEMVPAKGPRGPLEAMLGVCWAKDGKRIYVSALDGDAPGIFSVDVASGDAKRLGRGFQPQLSPDGQQLSFLDLVGGEPQLKIARPDLSAARKLEVALPMAARWSYDGRHFFYNVLARSGGYELWEADASGDKGVRVTAAGNAILSSTAVMLPSILRAMSRSSASPAPTIEVK